MPEYGSSLALWLSGGLLQLAALIGIGLMLALGYALDKIIPGPYPQRRQQPPKAPRPPDFR